MLIYVTRFMLGGILMVVTYWISQKSPSLSGWFSALPIFSGFSLLLFAVSKDGTFEKVIHVVLGSAKGMVCGFTIYFIVYLLLLVVGQIKH